MLKIIEESYILAYFGIFCTVLLVVSMLWKLFNLLKIHLFFRCSSNLIKYGKWSVITGGSSGILKGYAIELAKLGFDIMIISNELEALKDTVKEIRNDYGVRCRYVYVDLTEETAFELLSKGLCDIDVGILINCAGIPGNFPSYFLEETDINTYKMMALNINAVVHITRLILPSMLAKKKGAIVNISSMTSATPFPCVSVYSASKAFSDRFIRALYYENKVKESVFNLLLQILF